MNSAAELLLETAATLAEGRPVPSPCISVCRMNAASGLCEGCFRTLDEVAGWGMLRDPEKRAVWRLLEQRARQP